jgi:hypothetical protein
MSAISETIFETETHPGGLTLENRAGEKFKGDGFYNRADGFHTVQWSITNFQGIISIQGSLSVNPQETDWFKVQLGSNNEYTIDTTGKVSTLTLNSIEYTQSTTGSFSYNFVGNFVWVRARIENWTAGTVNSIMLSH